MLFASLLLKSQCTLSIEFLPSQGDEYQKFLTPSTSPPSKRDLGKHKKTWFKKNPANFIPKCCQRLSLQPALPGSYIVLRYVANKRGPSLHKRKPRSHSHVPDDITVAHTQLGLSSNDTPVALTSFSNAVCSHYLLTDHVLPSRQVTVIQKVHWEVPSKVLCKSSPIS